MFTFVFGLPWNELGLWRQTELASALLYGVNALIVAAIGGLLLTRHEDTVKAVLSPPLLAFLGFAVLGFVLLPASDNPMRSLHGTMKHGAGAIWYLELLAMTVAALVVIQSRWRLLLIGAAGLAIVGILGLYFYGGKPFGIEVGLPVSFWEWVGLAGGLVAFAIVAASTSRKGKIAAGIAAILILAVSYHLSDNRAVVLAIFAIALFECASWIPGLRGALDKPLVRAVAVTAVMLGGLAAIYLAAPVIEQVRLGQPVDSRSQAVLSNNSLDHHDLHMGSLGTIWSRSYMVRIVINDLLENPAALLTGRGWGSFETVYEKHARDVPGRVFATQVPSASLTYWDSHEKSNFHPHNMPAEALYATGVAGLSLWVLTFALLSYQSRKGFYAALALTVFFTFWFPINHVTMMLAFLLAAATVPAVASERAKSNLKALAPLSFVLAAALIILSVFFGRLLIVERNERAFLPVTNGSNPEKCAIYHFPLFPENEITTSLYTLLNRRIVNSSDPAQAVFDHTTNYIAFNCMVRSYQVPHPDLVSLVYSLKSRAQFAVLGPKVYGAFGTEMANWGADIDRLLEVAPGRTEFLAPYLTTLAERSPDVALAEIKRYLPRLKDADPVKDYLLFVQSKINGSSTEVQRQHLQAAADEGFGNIWTITSATIKEYDLK